MTLLRKSVWFVKQYMPAFVIAMLVATTQSTMLTPPNAEHWEIIEKALAIDQNINNDWGMGYWVLFKGGSTSSYGSYYRQEPPRPNQIVVTETEEADMEECTLLDRVRELKLYRC